MAPQESGSSSSDARDDALSHLEYEDKALLKLLEDFERPAERLEHGTVGKLFVEHLAVRQACREVIGQALKSEPEFSSLAEHLDETIPRERSQLNKLDEMARGIQPINLNQGQDFDSAVEDVASSLRGEIQHDLADIVPTLRSRLSPERRSELFPKASKVRRHAPTHLDPSGRKWHERWWPLVRVHALYDWLRGFPTGGQVPSGEVDVPGPERPV